MHPPMGIYSHGNKGHSHSDTGWFTFLPIPIPSVSSILIPMGFPMGMGIIIISNWKYTIPKPSVLHLTVLYTSTHLPTKVSSETRSVCDKLWKAQTDVTSSRNCNQNITHHMSVTLTAQHRNTPSSFPTWTVQKYTIYAEHASSASSNYTEFLLLARYVPNVAKRSIWDQCK